MKIYNRLVLDISTYRVLYEDSFEYDGPVARCGGGEKAPKAQESAASRILAGLSEPLSEALRSKVIEGDTTALTERAIEQGRQAARGGFGARGLAGSGIAQRAEQELASDIGLKGASQEAQQLIALLGAGSGSPVFAPAQQPKGLFGLK